MKTAAGTLLNLEKQKVISSIVVTTLLVSFSMLFATLFLIYALYRMTAIVWPPGGLNIPPIWWTMLSTVVILASSASLIQFRKSVTAHRASRSWYCMTLFLGMVFLFSQWGLWENLQNLGIYTNSSVLASIIYAFTWIHGAHIILGLIFFLMLVPWMVNKNCSFDKYFIRFQIANNFWHFLGVIWLIMYITLFII